MVVVALAGKACLGRHLVGVDHRRGVAHLGGSLQQQQAAGSSSRQQQQAADSSSSSRQQAAAAGSSSSSSRLEEANTMAWHETTPCLCPNSKLTHYATHADHVIKHIC
jgi:hypothetical protein